MPIKTGATIIDASIPTTATDVILGPYEVLNNISVGVDIIIQNGATAPASPLICAIEWERFSGLGYEGITIQGGSGSNDRIPVLNFKIPFDSANWRIRYNGGSTEPVTLTIKYGAYAP